MAIRVEHELHERRRGRNSGVLWLLVGMVGIVFGLTVVKVLNLEDISQLEAFDHAPRVQLEPGVIEAMRAAAEANAAEDAAATGAEEAGQ